jgi:hypothetical protein
MDFEGFIHSIADLDREGMIRALDRKVGQLQRAGDARRGKLTRRQFMNQGGFAEAERARDILFFLRHGIHANNQRDPFGDLLMDRLRAKGQWPFST